MDRLIDGLIDVDEENRSRWETKESLLLYRQLFHSPCLSSFDEMHCTAARAMVQSARPRARGAKRWSSHTNAAVVIRRAAVWPSAVPSRLHFCRHVMGDERGCWLGVRVRKAGRWWCSLSLSLRRPIVHGRSGLQGTSRGFRQSEGE